MRKITYIFALLVTLISCQQEDTEVSRKLINTTIDISDFRVYVGSPTGGVELVYNNLKKTEILSYYFGENYNPTKYANYYIDFNDKKLTYVYGASETGLLKIVSEYTYKQDSLFVKLATDSMVYIGIGNTKDYLHRNLSLVRYPYSQSRDTTLVSEKEAYSLTKVLNYMGYTTISEMTNVQDTIVWCNMKYIFKN